MIGPAADEGHVGGVLGGSGQLGEDESLENCHTSPLTSHLTRISLSCSNSSTRSDKPPI